MISQDIEHVRKYLADIPGIRLESLGEQATVVHVDNEEL